MLDKQHVLDLLEEERERAAQFNLPQMALGIAQAMKVIAEIEVPEDE